ncbi:alpha-1,4-N-acetylglucosaminyltransferase-like [Leptodactylus fuscus]
MLGKLKRSSSTLICAVFFFLITVTIKQMHKVPKNTKLRHVRSHVVPNDAVNPKVILSKGNGILFVETTKRMEPTSLILCAIESAARAYPDRPVIFFMNGLSDIITEEDEKNIRKNFPSLSSFNNVYFLPLRFEDLFTDTPLLSWYLQANPAQEPYWIHVLSDACRFSLLWTYGGIYMDTDIITIQPILIDHFVVAQTKIEFSSGVFGLSPQHALAWMFMENFVQNYQGKIWGHQGPGVVTRVLNKTCAHTKINLNQDVKCGSLSFFYPDHFYPIPYQDWERYFKEWDDFPTFNTSYGLHLWNFMNTAQKTMVPGRNTLVEHLYKNYCPSVFDAEVKKQKEN